MKTTYVYATVDAETFLRSGQANKPADSYLSMDAELKAIHEILKSGYRFICFSPDGRDALFEKQITQFMPKNEA